jgi:hypothetical protein
MTGFAVGGTVLIILFTLLLIGGRRRRWQAGRSAIVQHRDAPPAELPPERLFAQTD